MNTDKEIVKNFEPIEIDFPILKHIKNMQHKIDIAANVKDFGLHYKEMKAIQHYLKDYGVLLRVCLLFLRKHEEVMAEKEKLGDYDSSAWFVFYTQSLMASLHNEYVSRRPGD